MGLPVCVSVLMLLLSSVTAHRSKVALYQSSLPRAGMAQDLKELGIVGVDAEYKKVTCESQKKRMIWVEESSRKPAGNLAIMFMYLGAETEIASVDVARAGSSEWRSMNRSEAGGRVVWATRRAPAGPLRIRVVVKGGEWMWAEGEVLPAEWRAGAVYSSGVLMVQDG